MNKKGFIVWDTLIPWIIALIVLVLVVLIYVGLSGKGTGLISYLKDLMRFR